MLLSSSRANESRTIGGNRSESSIDNPGLPGLLARVHDVENGATAKFGAVMELRGVVWNGRLIMWTSPERRRA